LDQFSGGRSSDGGFYEADFGNNRVQRFANCAVVNTPTPTPTITPTPVNSFTFTPTPTPNGVYILRLDAGSTQATTDASSNLWAADQAYSTGFYGYTTGGTVYTSSAAVTGTNSPSLYQTYRAGVTIAYSFTLPPGHYQATLKIADFISPGPGQNVFNIQVQGETVATHVDIFSSAGRNTASDHSFREDLTSTTQLTVQLNATTGQAFLSAIEIRGLQTGYNPLINYFYQPGGEVLLP
jgi:hypothetical protein